MASLIVSHLIGQIVSLQYQAGDKAVTAYGQLVECDGSFVRILTGWMKQIRILDQQHLGACGTIKKVFKLCDESVDSSYELYNLQYTINIKVIDGVSHIIPFGTEFAVCDDRGNCEIVYNYGPLPIVVVGEGE